MVLPYKGPHVPFVVTKPEALAGEVEATGVDLTTVTRVDGADAVRPGNVARTDEKSVPGITERTADVVGLVGCADGEAVTVTQLTAFESSRYEASGKNISEVILLVSLSQPRLKSDCSTPVSVL